MTLGGFLQFISIAVGVGLVVVVAAQTSRSEGLSGILASGGGGGGKVGKDKRLEGLSLWLCYGWLAVTALAALIQHRAMQ
ncbi:MAG: hypothetical protein IT204_14210 [Fimbriimonadaceae bacterium]|nr:hypothetical protein [Fimbriimonadaceae bacterium]